MGFPRLRLYKFLFFFRTKHMELVQKLHNENLSIAEVQYSQEVQAMFTKMKFYHSKLLVIKKDIKGLHERSQRLKVLAYKSRYSVKYTFPFRNEP